MSEPDPRLRRIVLAVAALAGVGLAVGLASRDAGDPRERESDPIAGPGRPEANSTAASEAPIRIAENGRLTVVASDLPAEGAVRVALDLAADARGDGVRDVRIVSVDGRRIDARTEPIPDAETGVRLDIESDFLTRGLYMIQLETVDDRPLRIRRYVLDVQ